MKKTKYLLKTSKSEIPIDADEIPKIMAGLQRGTVTVLRQGMFNPSFFDSVVFDEKKHKDFVENHKYEIQEGKFDEIPAYGDQFGEVRAAINKVAEEKKLLK